MPLAGAAFCCTPAQPVRGRKALPRRSPSACAQHDDSPLGVTNTALHGSLRARRVQLHGAITVAGEDLATAALCEFHEPLDWVWTGDDGLLEPNYGGGGKIARASDESAYHFWERVSRDGRGGEAKCSEEDRALVVSAVSAFTACWLLGMAFAFTM